eukprot:727839-Rhodomonas_salina.1
MLIFVQHSTASVPPGLSCYAQEPTRNASACSSALAPAGGVASPATPPSFPSLNTAPSRPLTTFNRSSALSLLISARTSTTARSADPLASCTRCPLSVKCVDFAEKFA